MGFGSDELNKETAAIPEQIVDNPAVKPAEPVVIKPADEKLVEERYVEDVFHNKVGTNVDRFPQVISDLKGFAEGSPVKVTYYKEHYSDADTRGRHNTEESVHNAHNSVLKIMNFELRMTQALQFTHDVEENLSKLHGEAFTYPGFVPEIGDRFVYEIDMGKYGIFRIVNAPVRTSIRASTYYKIEFELIEYMTEELRAEMDKQVVSVAYFDKSRFLNEPGSLLLHDEVVEMEFMKRMRMKMIHYYQHKFLDETIMYSFMRPDNVYDPYVTDFMMKILEFSELGTLATQLYQGAPYLDVSIWRALLDSNVPLEAVPTSTKKLLRTIGSKSVLANSLTNKYYIEWIKSQNLKDYLDEIMNPKPGGDTPEGEIPPDPSIPDLPEDEDADKILGNLLLHIHPHYAECPLTENGSELIGGTGDGLNYILGDGDQFTLIAYFLLRREIRDLRRLHSLIEKVWKMEPIKQFYLMPVLVFLCSIVVGYIKHADKVFEP